MSVYILIIAGIYLILGIVILFNILSKKENVFTKLFPFETREIIRIDRWAGIIIPVVPLIFIIFWFVFLIWRNFSEFYGPVIEEN